RTRRMVRWGQRRRRQGKVAAAQTEAWQRAAEAWFSDVDVLVSPVVSHPAPPYGWGTRKTYLRSYLNGARTTPYTQAWNLTGSPAMSLALGGTASAPGSVQLVSLPGRVASLIALATELERGRVGAEAVL